jgi:uncharacterized membrane protein YedE/YeeE
MENFTPVSALVGGGLIGLAASMLLLVNGRVAGVSGIVKNVLKPVRGDIAWRLAFIAGLVAGPLLYALLGNTVVVEIRAPLALLVVAGAVVGFGTSMGSGCTSGHGVCGVARLSARSILATISFMTSGVLTVYVARHVLGIGL